MPITLHPKYRPLWTTDCFITIVTGGRGSGKSFAVGDFIENLSFQQNHKILFTRYTLYSASDSIIPEFQEKIDLENHSDHFKTTQTDVINKESGVQIMFRGIKTASGNQTAKLKSITNLTTWVLDEAEELDDENTFNIIQQSIRKKGIQNRIILVMNPKSKEHWIYKRFFETPGIDPEFNGEHNNVCYIKTTYFDNIQNLSAEFLAEAEQCRIKQPELYRYDYLGEWVLSIEGAFLPFDKLKRYKELNEEGVNLIYIDTADEGTDHFAAPIGRLIGSKFYLHDAVFNMVNLNVNEEVCKTRFEKHKPDKVYVETNSFGAYFYRNLKTQNDGIPFFGIISSANKLGRILAQSGWILEFMYFPENPNDELLAFMKQMCGVTSESKDNDDAADAIAGLAQMIRRDYLR